MQTGKYGTDPALSSSVLKMLSAALTNNPTRMVVTWQSVGGKTCFLERSTNLLAQPPFSSLQRNIVGQVGSSSFTDTTATHNSPCFYRVRVQ
jgi:hypothetical protein